MFGSITGNSIGGDCAVCLSKFESNGIPLWLHRHVARRQLDVSTVHPTEADVLNKLVSESEARIFSATASGSRMGASANDEPCRNLAGDYIVDEGYEVSVGSTHHRRASNCTEKDSAKAPISQPKPRGEILVAEVAGGQSWLKDYVDRISSISFSSRAMSLQSSGRFFTGGSRRSENVIVAAANDVEGNR
ncbi:hypothetical protein RJ639_027582, partial [Escallonia herrerae]